eukprot:TRINITY_DN681_c0_g1_i1.p1 TRINITY_DN681_c0_g1~~TRINITY_DN681_c0_g1_i1.p1  ORF type:complete len:110 (+),score=30.70 TRINITY_DN681_c0_g1_i1:105-434(+)
MTMNLGERAVLHIDSDFGYGARGAGASIPPNADLDFDVELIAINGLYKKGENGKNICAQCLNTEEEEGEYKRCAACKKVTYCSKACQTKHWKGGQRSKLPHKKACKLLR